MRHWRQLTPEQRSGQTPLRNGAIAGSALEGLLEPHHDGSELYVERLDNSVELRLRAPVGAAAAVQLWTTRDGEPVRVEATLDRVDDEEWWTAELPLRSSVLSYRWLMTGGRLGYRWVNAQGAHAHEVTALDNFKLAASAGAPDWHLSSVGYEIFLDRFASSGVSRALPSWAVKRQWGQAPDSSTRDPHREIYGGDLLGVEKHLDHVEALGANLIWLTPFFEGTSNHRYDPTSFGQVDGLLGGDAALASLLRAAHGRGMRVVGDLSLDHAGWEHEWFRRARADASSPERSLFLFDRTETNGYAGWLGYREMPRFDWRSEELRARIGDVVRRWLDFGLDGWRIGAAASIGRRSDVDLNAEVARVVRADAHASLLVAEYWNDVDLDGLGWHGVMSYGGFLRPVWWWLRSEAEAFDVFTAAPAPRYDGCDAARAMQAFRAGMPWEASLHSWLLLDSHDTPRFRGVTGSWERELVGLGLQMTSPGVPMVFSGAEIGLSGRWGYDARRTMPWETQQHWDERRLGEYRRLIALRRSSEALARGGMRLLHAGAETLLYLRETRTESILCLAARAPHYPIVVPFAHLETLYGEDARDGVLPAGGPAFHAWRVVHD